VAASRLSWHAADDGEQDGRAGERLRRLFRRSIRPHLAHTGAQAARFHAAPTAPHSALRTLTATPRLLCSINGKTPNLSGCNA